MKGIRHILTHPYTFRVFAVLSIALFGYWLFFGYHPTYPGNKAPDITFYSLQKGIPYQLSNFRGRWVFLNFWASWCPPCRDEFPDMIQLWQTMSEDHGWAFIFLNVAEPEGDARKFTRDLAQKMNVEFEDLPLFIDTRREANARFGVWKYPETFIIDPDGNIVVRIIGPQRWTDPRWIERFRQRNFR